MSHSFPHFKIMVSLLFFFILFYSKETKAQQYDGASEWDNVIVSLEHPHPINRKNSFKTSPINEHKAGIISDTISGKDSEVSQDSGWVKFNTNLSEFYLILDENFSNYYHMAVGDSIKLSSGNHKYRIVWRNINDKTGYIKVNKNKTTQKNIVLTLSRNPLRSSFNVFMAGKNTTIITDEKSKIYVDGKYHGENYALLLLSPGKHNLYIVHHEYGSLRKRIKVKPYVTTNEISRYNKNPYPNNHFLKLVPGMGYLKTGQNGKAILTYSGLALLTVHSFIANVQYNKKNDLYEKQYANYLAAESLLAANGYKAKALSTLNKMDKINQRLTYTYIGIGAIYLFSTIDGFLKPREGYSKATKIIPEISLQSNPLSGKTYTQLTYRKNF